ncbi:MAG: asparagine synthase (glutamine-hydrolyzing) [Syntrophales bacterium]|nr:asparagine synthase (glutamine-hydrolyzing) [Syntrophales bacterium]
MCGISGFIARKIQPAALIARMTDIICHRGPDDEGFVLFRSPLSEPVVAGGPDTPEKSWRAEAFYAPRKRIEQFGDVPVQIALGHRRLSIIDLSPLGHQPMGYQDGRFWITFNGEIYNYRELRCELESLGHHFLSQSDTEVILAAYAQWGPGCLNRFNGMWAFAIYDTAHQELFLARDRFGVKPLYYWVAPAGVFCFCSEIKQFTTVPGWSARVNPQRAYDFLVWNLADHTDETMFDRVYQIRPGHYMHVKLDEWDDDSAGRLPAEKWYALTAADYRGSFDEAAIEFRQHLKDSVCLRLRSDVPIGSCLSGGLDSSAIVCLMNQLLQEQDASARQKTFSACADVKRFDEREWIDEVVRTTCVDAHYIYPSSENLFKETPSIIWHQDEPFSSTSIYAQWNVFRLAAQNGVKVMLDGQGADEQLAGYHNFFGFRFAELFREVRWMRLWREIKETKRLHGYSELRSLTSMASVLLPSSIKNTFKNLLGKNYAKPPWLDLSALEAVPENPADNIRSYNDSIQSVSHSQLAATSIPILLHWEDRDSMAHSIESRVPFLDYRLVEFLLSLPDEYKLSDGITKRVLRKGLSGVLPDKIRDRMDKLGFLTPEEVWLKEQVPDMFRSRLEKAVGISQGILSSRVIDELDAMIAGRTSFSPHVWRMISFGEWMEVFSVKKS